MKLHDLKVLQSMAHGREIRFDTHILAYRLHLAYYRRCNDKFNIGAGGADKADREKWIDPILRELYCARDCVADLRVC